MFLTFLVFIGFGLFLFTKIPTSLLPSVDVPEIILKVNYSNTSAKVIEQNITSKIRDYLVTLDRIEDVQSQSVNHNSIIRLKFEHGTKMDLAYIDVNERLDRILNDLPKDLPRPVVVRVNTVDIPIVRIQVMPKENISYLKMSELTQKIIKKRIEHIPGVSTVDINGLRSTIIVVDPKRRELNAVGLSEKNIEEAIRAVNISHGAMSVKDGQYSFFVKLKNSLEGVEQISSVPLLLPDSTVSTVGQFARISTQEESPKGYHIFNGRGGLVLTVQKQASARMETVLDDVRTAVRSFKEDYPQIDFFLSQDQTFLLDEGIENLTQDLWYGGILCILLLFVFLGNYASPLLMSVSIPISLCLTFIFFYFFNISFNIISLSGLALGIGMLIDNSIVVLDSITRRRREGLDIDESCVLGVKDVVSPVISNVLTTVAIYGPLIYLSGLAGALVFDQAIALTISLGVSLIVAFALNPVMYKYMLKDTPEKLKEDTWVYLKILKGYHNMINHIFRFKKIYFWVTIAVMPIGFLLFLVVPIETLPKIKETETQVKIDWNIPLNAEENMRRVTQISKLFEKHTRSWEADIGLKQFMLQHDDNSIQKAEIYYKCDSEAEKIKMDIMLKDYIQRNYPDAEFAVNPAPNAFTQLFVENEPYLEARFRAFNPLSNDSLDNNISLVMSKIDVNFDRGISSSSENVIELKLDIHKMALYNVSSEKLQESLSRIFGSGNITEIKRFAETTQIKFNAPDGNLDRRLNQQVISSTGAHYPIKTFVSYLNQKEKKYILADKSGVYSSIEFAKRDDSDIKSLILNINKVATEHGMYVSYAGKYFSQEILAEEMLIIFFISIILLYLILAIQFENLVHPLLVMFTIPLGIGGAMLLLWLAGGTLNIMTGIGFIIVLGIIVDDPSLKVETINRLREEYRLQGMDNNQEILIKALHNAGEICLKPLLMVSLTTSLALLPVLFTGGIGNDLQKPMVYVIVGGLSLGTFLTLWFIPLAYWFITKKNR